MGIADVTGLPVETRSLAELLYQQLRRNGRGMKDGQMLKVFSR